MQNGLRIIGWLNFIICSIGAIILFINSKITIEKEYALGSYFRD